jgi:SAM-dependent methyltransferase
VSREIARFFDATAEDYDRLEPWYEHLYAVLGRLVRDHLAPGAGPGARRALDAGCGTAFAAALLAGSGFTVHGADLSAGLLQRARRRLPEAALVQADLVALPYAAETFAAVVCCGSTLSFVADPAAALREMGRVLAPGGRLLLECEHKWSLDLGWALGSGLCGDPLGYGLSPRALWRHLARPLAQGFVLAYPGYPPLRLFTRGEVAEMLAAAGLGPAGHWGIHWLTNLIPSTMLHRPALGPWAGALYRALCRMDARLADRRPARALGNSLVVLAVKAGG